MKKSFLSIALIAIVLIAPTPLEAQGSSNADKLALHTRARHTGVRRNFNRLIEEFPGFLPELSAVAGRLGIEPDWLLNVIACESSFVPAARNRLPGQTASGLLQIIESTAKNLGTTTTAIRRMNPIEQLQLVEKYFSPFRGRLNSLADVYTATFRGFIVSGGDEAVAAPLRNTRRERRAYLLNESLDLNRDGRITKGELARLALSVGRFDSNMHLAEKVQKPVTLPSTIKRDDHQKQFVKRSSIYAANSFSDENHVEVFRRSIYVR